MTELMACRRSTDQVGGDTAHQHEVAAHANVSGPAHAQSTHPLAEVSPLNIGAARSEAGGGGATMGVRSMLDPLPFREIWAVDFEFGAEPGENPEPVAWSRGNCAAAASCAYGAMNLAPRPRTRQALTCCLSPTTQAQKSVAISLLAGRLPQRVLDLFTEFRNHTNGIPTVNGNGLLGALAYHGLDRIGAIEKQEKRDLILRGGPYSAAERLAILDYCETDVEALARLLPAMLSGLICRAPCCAAVTWPPRHGLNETACQLILRRLVS